MADIKLRFGNTADIAFARAKKPQREHILSHPHGLDQRRSHIPPLPQEDFDKMFGELEPATDGENPEVDLKRKNGTYPRYELSPRVIMLSGWLGDPETKELERLAKWTLVDALSVRRPEKGKGPAPSWMVRDVAHPPGEEGRVFFIGRRGKYFIGETPETKE